MHGSIVWPQGDSVILDLDDTLCCTGEVYYAAYERAFDYILASMTKPCAREMVRTRFWELEAAWFAKEPNLTQALAHAMFETFTVFCPEAQHDLLRWSFRSEWAAAEMDAIADAIPATKLKLKPGARRLLHQLYPDHHLYLFTAGQRDAQRQRLRDLGVLMSLFSGVSMRPKSIDGFRAVLADHQLDPATTWMIGNSGKSDIAPALDAGMKAIHIRGGPADLWHFHQAELPVTDRLWTIHHLKEVPAILAGQTPCDAARAA